MVNPNEAPEVGYQMKKKELPKKTWAMPDGKTRNAGKGPWVASENIDLFLSYCRKNGHETRPHPDVWREGYQVRHQGHWMALLWNNGFSRYTADRRLYELVQDFSMQKHNIRKAKHEH